MVNQCMWVVHVWIAEKGRNLLILPGIQVRANHDIYRCILQIQVPMRPHVGTLAQSCRLPICDDHRKSSHSLTSYINPRY